MTQVLQTPHGGSASIREPEYWWYRARADLLETVLAAHVGDAATILDVGSADGPSVSWLRERGQHICLDVDPRGLAGAGVCASVLDLPFADDSFEVIGAFDVIEHCDPEATALAELSRTLRPGGRLLLSVPAYQWAWTAFDDENGHHRRYTRVRAQEAVRRAGLEVVRSTHIFAGVFPLFAAQRVGARFGQALRGRRRGSPADVVELPRIAGPVERALLGLCRIDRALLRRSDLPFGSSVVLVARKPLTPGARL